MMSAFPWLGRFNIPHALRLGHDEVRAGLVRATMGHGPITQAAKRVAQLCLPHFAWEERTVFPVLGLLPESSAPVLGKSAVTVPLTMRSTTPPVATGGAVGPAACAVMLVNSTVATAQIAVSGRRMPLPFR